jgi:hypothetical protein
VLAIARRGQEDIHQPLVGVGRFIADEGFHRLGRGGETGQVQGYPAGQRALLCFGCRREAFLLQAGEDEAVDLVAGPVGVLHRGWRWRDRRGEGPMFAPGRALINPAAERFNFLGAELLGMIRRRHPVVGIGCIDPEPGLARLALARHERRGA